MANVPLITTLVRITVKDINGNSVAKQFNQVSSMSFDYNKGMVNIVDVTGSFYFTAITLSSLAYTIVPNPAGSHTVVMS